MEHNNEETTHEQEHHAKKRKLRKGHKIGLGIVIAVLVVVVAGGLTWLYTGQVSSAKQTVFKAIPLPAAIVDMKFLPAKSILERVALSKRLLEEQGLGDKADPKQTFDQAIDVKKLEAVAEQHSIKASNEEIDEEYRNIVLQYAGGDENGFKDELNKTYHMSPEKFKSEIVKQQVLQGNLVAWYGQQKDLNKKSYDTANDLQNKLNSGQSFDDLAKAYTQDESTKDFAGDSGMIAFDDLLPEFREALKDSKTNDVKLVSSRYGLHLLKVLEVNNDGENGAKQIHLQQIYIRQDGFSDWLGSQVDNIRVMKLLNFS